MPARFEPTAGIFFFAHLQTEVNRLQEVFDMSNDIVVFSFHANNVRTLTKDGEVLFRASDVASVLGMRAPDVVRNLDEGDVCKVHTPTESGIQEMSYLSEPGLYTVLIRSNKEEAKPFRRWVTKEVLELARKEVVILQLQGKKKRERRWLVPAYNEPRLPGFPNTPRMVLKSQTEIKQPDLNIAKLNHLGKTMMGLEKQMAALKREIGYFARG